MEPITEDEEKLIVQLRERVKDLLSIPPEYLTHKNLIRWIRARNNKLDDAENMLKDHIRWRDEFRIDAVTQRTDFLPPEHSHLFQLDVYDFQDDGGCVHILSGKSIDLEKAVRLGLQTEVSQKILAKLEEGWRLNFKHSEGKDYIPKFISIYDMNGISASQFSSKEAITFGLNLARATDTNYPECAKRLIVLNAPWVFQIIWKFLKSILAQRTAERFVMLGYDKKEQRAEISKYLQVHQFPKKYGGDGDDTFKSVAELEKAYELLHSNSVKGFESIK